LRAALHRDGRRLLEALYRDRECFPDDEPARPLETCYRERSRGVQTLFGKITLRRRYYHHRPSGTGRCPLDEKLEIERGCTPSVARLMCRAASQSHSYAEAAASLRIYAGVDLEARRFGRLVAAEAPVLREALSQLAPALSPSGPPVPIPVLYVSGDGTGVPMRKEALEGRAGKQEDGSARTREAKLGCVFTQSVTGAEGEPLRDPDSTSYAGTFQGCREAGILLRQEAMRRGLGRAKKVVYLGDGAAWVWENCRLNFPGAVEILDFYHATEHTGALARALHDGDPERARSRQSTWCHAMKQSSPAAMLREVRALLEASPHWPEAKRTAIEGELNYLESHAARTRYGEFRAKGYFIGSGVMEAGCKTVIGRRLKQSGMFWSETGAENLLSLRCQILGPHFERLWKARTVIQTKTRERARRWSPANN
jgi:hypothetical protein